MSSNQGQRSFSLSSENHTHFGNPEVPPPSNYGISNGEQNPRQMLLNLTAEEIRTLNECTRESLFYRSIPLSIVLSGLAFIGMKLGYLRKNPNFGYVPKIFGAITLGYIVGKYSYRRVCMEKIMKLPNSALADFFRKKRHQQATIASNSLPADEAFPNITETPLSDYVKENLVLEEWKPDFSGYNDVVNNLNKASESLSPYTEGEVKEETPNVSYEELRRRNRAQYKTNDKYLTSLADPDRSRVSTPDSSLGFSSSRTFDTLDSSLGFSSSSTFDTPDSTPSRPRDDPSSSRNLKKNKYGDVVED